MSTNPPNETPAATPIEVVDTEPHLVVLRMLREQLGAEGIMIVTEAKDGGLEFMHLCKRPSSLDHLVHCVIRPGLAHLGAKSSWVTQTVPKPGAGS